MSACAKSNREEQQAQMSACAKSKEAQPQRVPRGPPIACALRDMVEPPAEENVT